MPSIAKPIAVHPSAKRNAIGLTLRDYEGVMSTLCAGCGHDSVTAAIVRALWESSIEPHMLAKMSGIGVLPKRPLTSPAVRTDSTRHTAVCPHCNGRERGQSGNCCISVSGDGDSLSIGLGHLCHAIRRNLRMVYIIENNGVYGLTKGQFSASADIGSKSKRGEANRMSPIDPISLGLSLGATFLARSFSGDKEQLVPILRAAMRHNGFALIDVVSPCVTFNDHTGSTKSYLYTRQKSIQATEVDFVPPENEILAQIAPEGETSVTMHDGSVIHFRSTPENYDPTDRGAVQTYLQERTAAGEIVTGLLYVNALAPDVHELNHTPDVGLNKIEFLKLCPGSGPLDTLMEEYR